MNTFQKTQLRERLLMVRKGIVKKNGGGFGVDPETILPEVTFERLVQMLPVDAGELRRAIGLFVPDETLKVPPPT